MPKEFENIRHTRGEGIGDGLNPERTGVTISYDTDTDGVSFTKYVSILDSMVAYDLSRRLPVRAWGFRTSSDALDMLAGDPNENQSANQPIYGKGRFDGGIHDSMNKLPNATTYGDSWVFPSDYNGVERTMPIGAILTAHTAEATPFTSVVRRSNSKPLASEQPIGFGLTLGMESAGLVDPTALPAGNWESKLDPDNTNSNLPLKAVPMNKGSDPFVDLIQYTGSNTYSQSNSPSAVSSTQFGVSGGFHHLRGNALHTNASAIDHSNTSYVHYPTTGWGLATHTNATINSLTPIPLSEISDHRQVQARTEPRLGFVIETESERIDNKSIQYSVLSTKAASLHSDLIVGQHFPVLPSWSVNTRFTTENMTLNPSSPGSQTISNPYTLPTWSPDSKDDKGDGGAAVSALSISNAGTGYTYPSGTLGFSGGGGGTGFSGTYTTTTSVASVNVSGGAQQYTGTTTASYAVTIAGNATGTYTLSADGKPLSAITVGGTNNNYGTGSGDTIAVTVAAPQATHNSTQATATAYRSKNGTIGSPSGQNIRTDQTNATFDWQAEATGYTGFSGAIGPITMLSGTGATTDSNGFVTSWGTVTEGVGYTSQHTVGITLDGASGPPIQFNTSGDQTTANNLITLTNNGTLAYVHLTNAGDGYTSAPSATPASGNATLTSVIDTSHATTRSLTAVTRTSAGSGYTSVPAVTIPTTFLSGGGSAGTATAVLDTTGPVASVSISAGGSGYTTAPTITLSGSGSSAVILATVTLPTNPPVINAQKTHAKDIWSVRGSADLPAWGGTYILRKTYLNRTEEGSLTTDVFGTEGNATTSNQKRRSIDYFVRPVRPLKLYGFASDLLQDGWVLGARSSLGDSDTEYQPFTRDNRYGVFESDMEQTLGTLDFISTAEGVFEMTWPDANELDSVFHLLPSTSMLQFFKSDAVRKTVDGEFNPEIEARYSQTTHPGGGESLHQSETRYRAEGTGISGDFVKQTTPDGVTHTHMDTAMRLYPQFKVTKHISNNVYLEDGSLLPASGTMFVVGKGKITYTGKTKNKLTGVTNSTGIGDLEGQILRYTTESSPSALSDMRSLTLPHLISPTYIDNTVVLAKQVSSLWNRYDATNDNVKQTTLSFRGLLEYNPGDFMMINQRPILIENGKTTAQIKTSSSSINAIRFDGKEISSSYFPPYVYDSKGFLLRVAGVETDELSTFLQFRNIEADSLADAGLTQGHILMGQLGFIGIRTSDAAMNLLNDAGSELAGFNVTPTKSLLGKDREVSSTLDAHPSLRLITDHSNVYTARKTRGLNIMEIIRNLTQIDGKQLVNESNGSLVYASDSFNSRGNVLGLGSAIRSVSVSKMLDSPNEIVVVGDGLANNERVFVVVKDLERMKNEASKGAKSNMVRTLRQDIPGLKTNKEALRLAKAILARAENGAPLVTIQGALKASTIQPGEIIKLDLPTHGLRGDFAVFEAMHNYGTMMSNFIVAQYDKGIEGILSDLQAVSGNSSPLDQAAGTVVDVAEISMSSGINIVAVHKVFVRNVSNTGFIIGAKHTNGMGKIGVRDGNKRSRPIGASKSLYYEVK